MKSSAKLQWWIVVFLLAFASNASGGTYTFSSFDYPGAAVTVANGINNNGEIVGAYQTNPLFEPDTAYLRDRAGNFTTINLPVSDAFRTIASGINDSGTIVGYYTDDRLANHGFINAAGSSTIFQVPGTVRPDNNTEVLGINNGGTAVGHWVDFTIEHGFTRSGDTITTTDFPVLFTFGTHLTGINNSGVIVGHYFDDTARHGFVRDAEGNFTSIDVPFPEAFETLALGVNDAGSIVGEYLDSDFNDHGFLYTGGEFIPIDFPGATTTVLSGINNSGTIVGTTFLCIDGDCGTHGFTATPSATVPEPAAVLLLSSGLVGIAAFRKKFRS